MMGFSIESTDYMDLYLFRFLDKNIHCVRNYKEVKFPNVGPKFHGQFPYNADSSL